jgi:glycosyltransferase involved in cell wall biosynthesis
VLAPADFNTDLIGMPSEPGEIDLSVIIPTRDRPAELREALESLARQDFPRDRYEVLVCDDGSSEDIGAVIDEMRARGLEVRHLRQEPKGPAAARNLGIRHARAPIVAMTDSDTRADQRWLGRLYAALVARPDAAGVEGKVYAENAGEFDPLGEGPTNLEGGVYLTCNCAYRRDVLRAAGGFDESFPYPAYEDTELAARVQEYGPIIWEPEAIVLHPQRRLTLRAVWKKLRHWEYVLLMGYRYGYLGWKRYPVRHPGWRVAALAVVALPLAKLRTAVEWFPRRPGAASKLAAFGIAEACGALLLVAPRALSGEARGRIERRRYLEPEEAVDSK